MDALEAIRERRSVRKFSDKLISEEDIKAIVDAGRLAATGNNVQPWEFVVITDKQRRIDIKNICPKNGPYIEFAPVCIVVICKETKYYLEDGSAATQNMLVAARALGIGSVWIAGDKKDYCEAILKYLEVPQGYKLVSLIAFGYPSDDNWPQTNKRTLEEVYHKEKF